MDAKTALAELGGIATTAELLRLTTRRRLRTAVRRGDVVRWGRRYALPGLEDAHLAAARLGGVVSHLSAAQHHGWKLKFPPPQPTITVPRRRRQLDQKGLEVHWADLAPERVEHRVTTPAQTVVDCARAYELDVALAVADSALRAGLDPDLLRAAAAAAPRTGRSKAVRVADLADVRAANPFESCLRAIADDVPGLHLVPQQWVGHIGCVDLYDAALGLVVEAESFEFHSDPTTFRQDVRRYTAIARLGLTVIRFTWPEVMHQPEYVRAVLLDVVRRGPR